MTDLGDMSVEDALAHYGVKGMRWGKRTARSRTPAEEAERKARFKKGAKIGAGVLVVGGAAAATAILVKNGNTKVTSLNSDAAAQTMARGKAAANAAAIANFKTKAAALSKDIAEANAEQDAWMRSIGLGAIVNNAK